MIGSGALGGFVPERSDVDLVAVCVESPSDERKHAIIDLLTREAMTWPVRGLEFVLYARAAVATPSSAPQFEINLNVGRRMPVHVSLDPAEEPAHWFVVDLAILREHGVALTGPPARPGRADPPGSAARRGPGIAGLAIRRRAAVHSTVLNAGRAWRYAQECVWSLKDDAAMWVLSRTEDPSWCRAPWRSGTAPPWLCSSRPVSTRSCAAFASRSSGRQRRLKKAMVARIASHRPGGACGGSQQIELASSRDRVGAAGHAEFGVESADVGLDRVHRDVEGGGDLVTAEWSRQEPEEGAFSVCEIG
jgi:hypothetical protein